MERPNSLLTTSQREYLRGEKNYDNEDTIIKQRNRIRKRIWNGLLDLELLNKHLNEKDRQLIFENKQAPDLNPDLGPEGVAIREDEIAGLVNGIEFLYGAAQDANISFIQLLELSIASAENRRIGDYFEVTNVSVEFSVDQSIDYSRIANQITNDESLEHKEYLALFELFREDPKRFDSLLADLDINIEERVRTENQLSVGESLVVVAHMGHQPEHFENIDVIGPLADKVVHDFGLDSFGQSTQEEQADVLTTEIAEEL